MARAIGIDLGGTKIEAQVFDDSWALVDRKRVATPKDYDALVPAMRDQIKWADGVAGNTVPVGISAAGLLNRETGLAFASNIPVTDKPFPADIAAAIGRDVTYINDCRALTLSEAAFGVARGLETVVGLILGTGVGGGLAVGGKIVDGPIGIGGEFGHLPAPAPVLMKHNLPLIQCGCGRVGCIERYLAGPGMTRLAEHCGAGALSPEEIASRRDEGGAVSEAWTIWLEVLASTVSIAQLATGAEAIVLAGGLSRIEGLPGLLETATAEISWPGFPPPKILVAQGGDATGARGAAYAAWCENGGDHV